MSKIKVMVVDDSAFMRKVITDMLETDQQLEVIGTARNGRDALQKLEVLQPDVITLDVEMPEMDGLDTLHHIQKVKKVPVIMLSSTTTAGAENTMIALENGAFDFVTKPSGPISLDLPKVKEELIEKLKLAFNHHQRLTNRRRKTGPKTVTAIPESVESSNPLHGKSFGHKVHSTSVILIGTSTGGPKALFQLLSSLPRLEHTAILIVQHMPPGFTKSLANRLDQQTDHLVSEARHGEVIQTGHVYIAPGGYHMVLKQEKHNRQVFIQLNEEPPRGGHRPSVNALLESAMDLRDTDLMAVIMTGMGKDGTEGLQKLTTRQSVYVLAEDESSCIVYGMPRAVIEANLAQVISPLDQIHKAIIRWLNQ